MDLFPDRFGHGAAQRKNRLRGALDVEHALAVRTGVQRRHEPAVAVERDGGDARQPLAQVADHTGFVGAARATAGEHHVRVGLGDQLEQRAEGLGGIEVVAEGRCERLAALRHRLLRLGRHAAGDHPVRPTVLPD